MLMLSFLIGMVGHAERTQNDKYAASLQYVKKELSYEVEVLHADKHGNILKVDTVIFVGFGQVCPKYLGRFAISL